MTCRAWLVSAALGVSAAMGAIPDEYEVASTSPDGRFAVLNPLRERDVTDYPPNLLVRLEPYDVLARLTDHGLPDGYPTELLAEWSGDATVAIWTFRKWGMLSLRVFELSDNEVVRVHDIWSEVREILHEDFRTRLLAKYPDEQDLIIFVSDPDESEEPEFEFRGRRVHIDAFADNKPNLAPGPHWSARLVADWNLESGELENVKLVPGPVEVRGEP